MNANQCFENLKNLGNLKHLASDGQFIIYIHQNIKR